MKTESEWLEEYRHLFGPGRSHGCRNVTMIQSIQLDAVRHGMRLAAEIVGSDAVLQMEAVVWGKLAIKKQEILDAADNLKEI